MYDDGDDWFWWFLILLLLYMTVATGCSSPAKPIQLHDPQEIQSDAILLPAGTTIDDSRGGLRIVDKYGRIYPNLTKIVLQQDMLAFSRDALLELLESQPSAPPLEPPTLDPDARKAGK